jgi:hypothetical protein
VSLDSWLNSPVKHVQMLFEERSFLVINSVNDIVVISHNQHDVFSKDSQLIFSLEQLQNMIWNVNET